MKKYYPRSARERLMEILGPVRPKTPAERVGEQVAELEKQKAKVNRRLRDSQFGLPPAQPGDLSQQVIERQVGQAQKGRSRGR